MHPYLTQERLHPREQAALRELLRRSPWTWPPADHPARERALEVAGLEAPPRLEPGEAALLSANPSGGAEAAGLWRLRLHAGFEPALRVPLDEHPAWEAALAAARQAAPLQWRSARSLLERSAPPPAELVDLVGPPQHVLRGASFGLSFLLAALSDLWDLPLPSDLTATAAVGLDDLLAPVEGLPAKLSVLIQRAPGVARLLVAEQDAEAARAAARAIGNEELQIFPCKTTHEAVAHAFPDLEAHWLGRGSSPTAQAQAGDELFGLALGERDEALAWGPVSSAAESALSAWSEGTLLPEVRSQLNVARAIAARHEGRLLPLETPPPQLFARLPQPKRTAYVAHLVQHAADTGTPPPKEALALAERFLVHGSDAFPAHLRLLGAKGRLLAANADLAEALAVQQEALQGWLDRPEAREASYPLCESYRLSGALLDAEAFTRTEELHRQVDATLRSQDRAFVTCERGAALVRLEHGEEARPLLEEIHRSAAPAFLRMRAARHLRPLLGARVEDQLRKELAEAARTGELEPELHSHLVALLELEFACSKMDPEAAEAALGRLRRLRPPSLHAIFERTQGSPAALLRAHPY